MKKYFRSKHLQQQIILLFLFSLFSLLLLGASFYRHMYRLLLQKEENHIEDTVSLMYEQVKNATESTVYYANMLATNSYAQNSLVQENPSVNYRNSQILFQIIPGVTQNNPWVHGVMLLNLHDIFISYDKRYELLVNELDRQYAIYSPDDYYTGFTGVVGENQENGPFYIYIQPIFQTSPTEENFSRKIGTCLILNTTRQMQEIIDQISMPGHSDFMVLNADNQLIASNRSSHTQDALAALIPCFAQKANDTRTLKVRNNTCLAFYKTIPSNGWKIVSVIPENEIYRELHYFFSFIFLFAFLILIIFLLWYYQVSHNILRPVYHIIDFMSMGADHNLHHRMPVTSQNEIGMLIRQVNILLDEIEALTCRQLEGQTRLYQIELEKKKAELSALQSQINPHFLYNTLENLKGFGYLLHSREIVEITTSLSFIMRYCIKGAETVQLRDELECVRKYLNIISIRFDNRITYQFDIADEFLDVLLPRFILQPIVENAVYHGLESLPSGGLLQIRALQADGVLFITVRDNGRGIPPETLLSLQKQLDQSNAQDTLQPFGERSIGLININNRLRVIYGSDYHITIESAPNRGTIVTATVPLQPL